MPDATGRQRFPFDIHIVKKIRKSFIDVLTLALSFHSSLESLDGLQFNSHN